MEDNADGPGGGGASAAGPEATCGTAAAAAVLDSLCLRFIVSGLKNDAIAPLASAMCTRRCSQSGSSSPMATAYTVSCAPRVKASSCAPHAGSPRAVHGGKTPSVIKKCMIDQGPDVRVGDTVDEFLDSAAALDVLA